METRKRSHPTAFYRGINLEEGELVDLLPGVKEREREVSQRIEDQLKHLPIHLPDDSSPMAAIKLEQHGSFLNTLRSHTSAPVGPRQAKTNDTDGKNIRVAETNLMPPPPPSHQVLQKPETSPPPPLSIPSQQHRGRRSVETSESVENIVKLMHFEPETPVEPPTEGRYNLRTPRQSIDYGVGLRGVPGGPDFQFGPASETGNPNRRSSTGSRRGGGSGKRHRTSSPTSRSSSRRASPPRKTDDGETVDVVMLEKELEARLKEAAESEPQPESNKTPGEKRTRRSSFRRTPKSIDLAKKHKETGVKLKHVADKMEEDSQTEKVEKADLYFASAQSFIEASICYEEQKNHKEAAALYRQTADFLGFVTMKFDELNEGQRSSLSNQCRSIVLLRLHMLRREELHIIAREWLKLGRHRKLNHLNANHSELGKLVPEWVKLVESAALAEEKGETSLLDPRRLLAHVRERIAVLGGSSLSV